jgi:hypothetical protein
MAMLAFMGLSIASLCMLTSKNEFEFKSGHRAGGGGIKPWLVSEKAAAMLEALGLFGEEGGKYALLNPF